ncbi:MAG: VWA domain-containing protein [Akkermansiaceae bacterium]|nr:VWA domain-containing protein [Akkermansiaceae bacterium]
MKRSDFLRRAVVLGGGVCLWAPAVSAHGVIDHHHHWFMPHVRPPHPPHIPPRTGGPVEVRRVDASVRISGQVATTTLTVALFNPAGRQQEGQVLLPVPRGAALKSFRLEGQAGSFQAELLPRDEARRIYDEIVRRSKDPAILEFAGLQAIKSSVFPVGPRQEARVQLTYEELLPADGGRVDYVLPRSESLDYEVPWRIDLSWDVKGGIATAYSPSHPITPRRDRNRVTVTLDGRIDPGAFRLSVLKRKKKAAVATFLSHPDARGPGGYFLMLMAPPEPDARRPQLKREVTLVLDRSGSMAGEKLDQARAAAMQVVEGLEDGEHFNIIVYNEAVERFSRAPVVVNRENVMRARRFINGIRVSGGTNIHDALMAAIRQPRGKNSVPIVLFLTDGLPTIGETSEKRIREVIAKANTERRRVFTFGVGVDVNTPLLSRLADDSRATASYVLPKEKVEVKVGQVFRRLSGPVLADPAIEVVDAGGRPVPGALTDLLPHRLPDFFVHDQVVLVGRYDEAKPLQFRLTGHDGAKRREYEFQFKPGKNRHPFVPRLWAMRKIAVLTEALRDMGADSALTGFTGDQVKPNDPRAKELIDEIVRLSTEHGILTEYTAFLARDGAVFQPQARQEAAAADNFRARVMQKRSGADSVNQEMNLWAQKGAGCVNPTNFYIDAELKRVQVGNVQQVADKAFYKRGNEWVDASVAAAPAEAGLPVEDIAVGSEQFQSLVDRLVANDQQGCLALGNNLDLVVEGKRYRLR